MGFDPYHEWLNIPESRRPPTPHDLLGLKPGETDRQRIREAAKDRYDRIRQYTLGPDVEHANRILNELGDAVAALLTSKGGDASERRAIEEMVEEWLGAPQENARREPSVPVKGRGRELPDLRERRPPAPLRYGAQEAETTRFDPYLQWFDIPASHQLPTHYELLGLAPGETNRKRIHEAALKRNAILREHATGRHADEAKRLIAEVAHATRTLLGTDDALPQMSEVKEQPCRFGNVRPLLLATAGAMLAAPAVRLSVGGTLGLFLCALTVYLIVAPFTLRLAYKSVLPDATGSAICILFPSALVTSLLILVGSVWAIMIWPALAVTLMAVAAFGFLAFFGLHRPVAEALDTSNQDSARIFGIYHLLSIFATVLVLGLTIVPLHFFFGR